ncbi:hypothetical protein BDV98DRAFT_354412 [Pterulicium gracile]|uniref:Uncharacterized protein n=1 Tax=Pterulicium gracile TaxID=1884261 RepID=A0A5C3QT10_9AGAR|nr:hypothetical protein BDV98DRAFT_354412 [Pterula gracilis]
MAAFQPIQPPTTEVPPLKDSEHIKDTIVAVEEQPEQGAAAVEVAKYDDEEVPSLKQEDAPVSLQPTEVEVTKVPVPEVHGAVLETPSFEAPTTDLATKDVTLSADTTKISRFQRRLLLTATTCRTAVSPRHPSRAPPLPLPTEWTRFMASQPPRTKQARSPPPKAVTRMKLPRERWRPASSTRRSTPPSPTQF